LGTRQIVKTVGWENRDFSSSLGGEAPQGGRMKEGRLVFAVISVFFSNRLFKRDSYKASKRVRGKEDGS